jgi:hypothetical protein
MPASTSPFGFIFDSHGVCLEVRSNIRSVLDAVQDHLPPTTSRTFDSENPDDFFDIVASTRAAQRGERCTYRLYHGASLLIHTASLDVVLDELESELHATVALLSSRLFVHAGVVGWRQCAIIIPGRSRSGKTTLVVELIRAGATYYSDEFAVFDQNGYVFSYPRSLSLRGTQDGHRIKRSAAELGGRVGTDPLPVALVVATHYDEHARWQPQVISPGQAVLRLFENTIDAIRRPQCAISIFARVVANCLAISGPRPSSEQIAPSLLSLCDRVGHGLEPAGRERTLSRL